MVYRLSSEVEGDERVSGSLKIPSFVFGAFLMQLKPSLSSPGLTLLHLQALAKAGTQSIQLDWFTPPTFRRSSFQFDSNESSDVRKCTSHHHLCFLLSDRRPYYNNSTALEAPQSQTAQTKRRRRRINKWSSQFSQTTHSLPPSRWIMRRNRIGIERVE